MIYSDGQLIYIFSKARDQCNRLNRLSEESTTPLAGVHATNNQILGFIMLSVANMLSFFTLQTWKSNLYLLSYLVLSVLEY